MGLVSQGKAPNNHVLYSIIFSAILQASNIQLNKHIYKLTLPALFISHHVSAIVHFISVKNFQFRCFKILFACNRFVCFLLALQTGLQCLYVNLCTGFPYMQSLNFKSFSRPGSIQNLQMVLESSWKSKVINNDNIRKFIFRLFCYWW